MQAIQQLLMGLEDERRRKEMKANALPTLFLSKRKELAMGLEIKGNCISKTLGLQCTARIASFSPSRLFFIENLLHRVAKNLQMTALYFGNGSHESFNRRRSSLFPKSSHSHNIFMSSLSSK